MVVVRRAVRPLPRVPRPMRSDAGRMMLEGDLMYPVFANSSGTSRAFLVPLQLQYFAVIWRFAQMYNKVKLTNWSVTYRPQCSQTRDGTLSLLFDPDASRVMSPDEEFWAQSKNAHVVRNNVYRATALKFQPSPEYHEGGVVALSRTASSLSYHAIVKGDRGWEGAPAGTAIPVAASYGTSTTTEGAINPLIPALMYITRGALDAAQPEDTDYVVGYLNFHVGVSLSQMELGTTAAVTFSAAGPLSVESVAGTVPVVESVVESVPVVASPGPPEVAASVAEPVNSDG